MLFPVASDCLGVKAEAAPGELCTLELDALQEYLQMLF